MPVGRSRFSGCCNLNVDLDLPRCPESRILELAAVTRTRRFILSNSFTAAAIRRLRRCPFLFGMISERFVRLSAHPQLVQQYRQLPGHRYHSALLGIATSPLGQLQPPPSQVAI